MIVPIPCTFQILRLQRNAAYGHLPQPHDGSPTCSGTNHEHRVRAQYPCPPKRIHRRHELNGPRFDRKIYGRHRQAATVVLSFPHEAKGIEYARGSPVLLRETGAVQQQELARRLSKRLGCAVENASKARRRTPLASHDAEAVHGPAVQVRHFHLNRSRVSPITLLVLVAPATDHVARPGHDGPLVYRHLERLIDLPLGVALRHFLGRQGPASLHEPIHRVPAWR
mmetsp:Transcript_11909/g.34887  ORF Transcript_11909/g.34887 Transcript_11909/m.34887 type:complete len:225 (+) Transcript_11909:2984-3658(+)